MNRVSLPTVGTKNTKIVSGVLRCNGTNKSIRIGTGNNSHIIKSPLYMVSVTKSWFEEEDINDINSTICSGVCENKKFKQTYRVGIDKTIENSRQNQVNNLHYFNVFTQLILYTLCL